MLPPSAPECPEPVQKKKPYKSQRWEREEDRRERRSRGMGIMLSLVIYTVEDSSDFTARWVYQDTRITKAQLLPVLSRWGGKCTVADVDRYHLSGDFWWIFSPVLSYSYKNTPMTEKKKTFLSCPNPRRKTTAPSCSGVPIHF